MFNVEDILLIKGEENIPRTQWCIGKASKLVIGKDAQVRGAELVVISKTEEKTVCQRPIQKLIQFELTTDNRELSNNKPVNDSKGEDETHILNSRKPTRKAKEEGQYLRELQTDMVDYSSTGGSVESDVNVTTSTEAYRYLNVFL